MLNVFSYNRLSLSAFINFVNGNMVYNRLRGVLDSDGVYPSDNQMVLPEGENRWEQPGDIVTHPKPISGGNKLSNSASSRWLEDGSYIRLRNIRFSYELSPSLLSKIKINKASVFLSGDNLWTGTKYSGIDPEVEIGTGTGISFKKYPLSKKILFGINIQL